MGAPNLNSDEKKQKFEELIRCSILGKFPREFLTSVYPIIKFQEFKAGEVLLKEGERNTCLFFLYSGKVLVSVSGEAISIIEDAGQHIGEMSMITGAPGSATLTVLVDSEFLIVDHKLFSELAKKTSLEAQVVLYKTLSGTLVERLQATNDKARGFEAANRELEKAQKELEDLHQQQFKEIYSSQATTMEKLKDLYDKDLKDLSRLLNGQADDVFVDIDELRVNVDSVIELVRPITESFSSDKALRNKRVLLAEENVKQQRLSKMALGGTGVSLDIVGTMEQAEDFINNNSYDILIVNPAFISLAEMAHKKNSNTRTVLISSDAVSNYIREVSECPFIKNVVSRNEDDRSFTVKNVFTTVGKLGSSDIFGLEKYLSWGADIRNEKILSSEQRPELIANMGDHFAALGIRESVIDRCRLVCEEMLMNVIYDAPVDSNGKSVYNHLDRTQSVILKDHEQGKMRYACDGMVAGVSVEDPFGALNRDTLLKYLESCYDGRAGQYNEKKGGGGMGIHLIVETADLAVFNVRPGFRTEVIGLFNVDRKASEESDNPPFHLFYLD